MSKGRNFYAPEATFYVRVVSLNYLQIENSHNSRIILSKDGGSFHLPACMVPPCGHSVNSLVFWLAWSELKLQFLKNSNVLGTSH